MNYIDLFAGAGGLSEGFIRAGFRPVAHVELDEAACYSLKTRVAYHYLKQSNQFDVYCSYLKGELTRLELYSRIPFQLLSSVINYPIGAGYNDKIHRIIKQKLVGRRIDLIIGGPPCQAYSLVGRARSENGMQNDPRNYLYIQYAEYLKKYQPKFFVFENVVGLKSARGGFYLKNMEKLFAEKGYKMHLFTVDASSFGVLQQRRRVIIIGWRDDFIPNLPNLDNVNYSSNFKVKHILNDLPFLSAGEGVDKYVPYRTNTNRYLTSTGIRNGINVLTQHVARPHRLQDKEIYKIAVRRWSEKQERLNYNDLPHYLKTHKNTSCFFDRFKVVAGDLPAAQTVVAHIAKDGHYYIHPDIKQNRSLTVREAARLQSFPDDYYFEGIKESPSRTAAFKQIGNAVPPLMAYHIAGMISDLL